MTIPERQEESAAATIFSAIALVCLMIVLVPIGFLYALLQCRPFLWLCAGALAGGCAALIMWR